MVKSKYSDVYEQKTTTAALIENMNENQIDAEIAKAKSVIASAEKTMERNDIAKTQDEQALSDNFPLGPGGSGWSKQQRRQQARNIDRNVEMAKAYNDALSKRDAARSRLEQLQKAKGEIAGTGKTQRQLRDEVKQNDTVASSIKWQTKNGVRTFGEYTIRGSSSMGLFTILRNGEVIGRANKLADAKWFAERDYKRRGRNGG